MRKSFVQSVPAALVGILIMYSNGCVEVPDNGIVPPDYVAQVRVIYMDPALPTSSLSLANANGSSFTPFSDLPSGGFGTASDYVTYKAGAKKIYVKKADGTLADPDTATITFGTETVGALIVLPRRAVADIRILQIGERSTFQTPGIADSARVRFANCLTTKDTVDVWRIRGSSAPGIVSNNLRYPRTPLDPRTSAFVNVPKDSTWRFYITRYTGSTAGIGDTVRVVGASNKQFTVVLYDSLARMKVLTLEDK